MSYNQQILTNVEYPAVQTSMIEACMRGERKAQFALYQQYHNAMYHICVRMLSNEEDARDILQNSFVDVFTKINTFQHQSSIGYWIKRIVINNCINHLKKRKLVTEEWQEHLPQGAEEPCYLIETNDQQHLVRQVNEAILQLPDGYRVVLTLYLFEGYDHEEIACIMGISEQTSKSQYSRAKQRLREILRPAT